MKITFSACEIAMGHCIKIAAIVGTNNLKDFLNFTGINALDFNLIL
jgi:hypothetical protein